MSETRGAYEKIMVPRSDYAMLKCKPAPTGFNEVHLTVSLIEGIEDGDYRKITPEFGWKLPHFTFVEMSWMGDVNKVHVFILAKDGEFSLVTADLTAFKDIKGSYVSHCNRMLRDGKVRNAIEQPENFVKVPEFCG